MASTSKGGGCTAIYVHNRVNSAIHNLHSSLDLAWQPGTDQVEE